MTMKPDMQLRVKHGHGKGQAHKKLSKTMKKFKDRGLKVQGNSVVQIDDKVDLITYFEILKEDGYID